MARISLNCSCGWTFFIPGTTTGHEVTCASCGQSVRIPGRKPGQDVPMSPGALAAEMAHRQGIIRWIVGGVAIALVAGAIAALVPSSKPAPKVQVEKPHPVIVAPTPPPVIEDRKREVEPAKTSSRLYSKEQIDQFKRTVREQIWLINLSTMVSEIARYRNLLEGTEKLHCSILDHEATIRSCLAELLKVKDMLTLEPYFAAGDRIIGFGGIDFRSMYPGAVAQVLHNWALAWSPGPICYQAIVMREGRELAITFMFPEETPELRWLLGHAALKAEVLSSGASDRAAFPADLLRRYQSGFEALPAGYLQFLPPAVRPRLKELMDGRMASADEVEWLKTEVLGDMLPVLEADLKAIRQKIGELEPAVRDNPAPDAVYLKDGSKLDGKVSDLGAEKVRVQFRQIGRTLSREDILRIEKGKGIGSDVAKQLEASKGSVDKLMSVMALCGGKNLSIEKSYVACQILLLDPTHDKARTALSLGRPFGPRSR